MLTEELTTEPSLDIDATVEGIANDLFPVREEPAELKTPAEAPITEVVPETAPTADTPTQTEPPTVRQIPKSWPKEMHEHWAKIDPKVQEYWETREKQMLDGLEQYKGHAALGKSLQDVITPFQPILQAHGVGAPQAVHALLTAHARLTQGSLEQRQEAYRELGRNLKLTDAEPNAAPVDPTIRALQEKVTSFETALTARQQADLTAAREKASKEVEAFATDPAHPYFDEVHDDLIVHLKSGASLQDAYDKAVWANPVTRAKELSRTQTEHEKKLKENARLDALKAKTASSANVRSRETKRAPTEPLGTMEDTMKATLAEIRSRAH